MYRAACRRQILSAQIAPSPGKNVRLPISSLETARETEPFDPSLFEPRSSHLLGEEEIEFDAEEVEELRKDDIRQCTRDLLLVERAREWLLEDAEK